jgi:hypothetical protein
MRGKRLNTKLIGTMRTRMTLSCSSRTLRSSCASPARRRSPFESLSNPPSWPSMDWVITSSPTLFIRSSIFSTLTRMDPTSAEDLWASLLLTDSAPLTLRAVRVLDQGMRRRGGLLARQ